MNFQFDQIYDCITIESNCSHQFECHFNVLACMNILSSLRKILCFRRRPQQVSLRPLHFDVERTKTTNDVYFNVPRS